MAIDMSITEALMFLRKWKDEGRLVQAVVWRSSMTYPQILGRIENVDDSGMLEIDASSMYKYGKDYKLSVNLPEAARFGFEDPQSARVASYFQSPVARELFESFLFIEFGDWLCVIEVIRTGAERLQTP
jgi:hypothetical protein